MSEQDTGSESAEDRRGDDRNELEQGTPVPDPEEEQGDAEDVPEAD